MSFDDLAKLPGLDAVRNEEIRVDVLSFLGAFAGTLVVLALLSTLASLAG